MRGLLNEPKSTVTRTHRITYKHRPVYGLNSFGRKFGEIQH